MMSILGFFSSKETKTDVVEKSYNTASPLSNHLNSPKQSYLKLELSSLKEYARELDHKERVSKKQRQELMARVFTTLDLAEKEITAKDE
jgi:hypothetical protein